MPSTIPAWSGVRWISVCIDFGTEVGATISLSLTPATEGHARAVGIARCADSSPRTSYGTIDSGSDASSYTKFPEFRYSHIAVLPIAFASYKVDAARVASTTLVIAKPL